MLDVLQDAIKLSKERRVNSAKDFYVAHTFNYGYANPVTTVKGGKFRSKVIVSIGGISKLLEDVNAKDMKEQGYTILASTVKGVKLPKKVTSNDVITLAVEVTEDSKNQFAIKAWLKKAIETGATISNPEMITDKVLRGLIKGSKSAEPKSKQGTINPIKDELVRLMNEHKNKPAIVNSLKEIMKLAEGC